MRVLIVEDEPVLREQLAERLGKEGFAVDLACDGTEATFSGCEYPIDVAIVDLGLPDGSGLDAIRHWRAQGRDFPVLILTARDGWQHKVEGLDAGADDYVVKPAEHAELVARLRALLRRSKGAASSVLANGPLSLDTATRSLAVDGARVNLTGYEYRLLEYLMFHAGRVITKTELSEHIYSDDVDPDSNVLEVLVGRLRKKLDPGRSSMPIETLRGQGYRLRRFEG